MQANCGAGARARHSAATQHRSNSAARRAVLVTQQEPSATASSKHTKRSALSSCARCSAHVDQPGSPVVSLYWDSAAKKTRPKKPISCYFLHQYRLGWRRTQPAVGQSFLTERLRISRIRLRARKCVFPLRVDRRLVKVSPVLEDLRGEWPSRPLAPISSPPSWRSTRGAARAARGRPPVASRCSAKHGETKLTHGEPLSEL